MFETVWYVNLMLIKLLPFEHVYSACLALNVKRIIKQIFYQSENPKCNNIKHVSSASGHSALSFSTI